MKVSFFFQKGSVDPFLIHPLISYFRFNQADFSHFVAAPHGRWPEGFGLGFRAEATGEDLQFSWNFADNLWLGSIDEIGPKKTFC